MVGCDIRQKVGTQYTGCQIGRRILHHANENGCASGSVDCNTIRDRPRIVVPDKSISSTSSFKASSTVSFSSLQTSSSRSFWIRRRPEERRRRSLISTATSGGAVPFLVSISFAVGRHDGWNWTGSGARGSAENVGRGRCAKTHSADFGVLPLSKKKSIPPDARARAVTSTQKIDTLPTIGAGSHLLAHKSQSSANPSVQIHRLQTKPAQESSISASCLV